MPPKRKSLKGEPHGKRLPQGELPTGAVELTLGTPALPAPLLAGDLLPVDGQPHIAYTEGPLPANDPPGNPQGAEASPAEALRGAPRAGDGEELEVLGTDGLKEEAMEPDGDDVLEEPQEEGDLPAQLPLSIASKSPNGSLLAHIASLPETPAQTRKGIDAYMDKVQYLALRQAERLLLLAKAGSIKMKDISDLLRNMVELKLLLKWTAKYEKHLEGAIGTSDDGAPSVPPPMAGFGSLRKAHKMGRELKKAMGDGTPPWAGDLPGKD